VLLKMIVVIKTLLSKSNSALSVKNENIYQENSGNF